MKWKTRLTELLGCQYPIMQGALSGVGTWEFAAAVSEAGAVGCLTAAVSKTPEQLRADIQKLREATKNPFTVNLTIGMCPRLDEMLAVCLEEKVPCIETAAFSPDQYVEPIKQSGITWIHKVATVEHARRAQKLGADAVVLVGLEGYGFKNIRQLPTLTSVAWAKRQIEVPLIAAGGIGDSRTMLGTLLAGADGVYVGSVLMATRECPIAERVKLNMVQAKPDHPDLIRELLAPPKPDEYKEIMTQRNKLPLEKWLPALERVMLKQHEWKDTPPMWEVSDKWKEDADAVPSLGDRPKGPFSFACAYVDEIVTVKEVIENMVKGAEEILERVVKEWLV